MPESTMWRLLERGTAVAARSALAALLAGPALTTPAIAQETRWQDELAAEIKIAQSCDVAYLSQVVERTIEGRQLLMAKVHCQDRRVFDATRTDAFAPFDFKECAASTTTQAC